jgi:hypothetical protein
VYMCSGRCISICALWSCLYIGMRIECRHNSNNIFGSTDDMYYIINRSVGFQKEVQYPKDLKALCIARLCKGGTLNRVHTRCDLKVN